MASPGAARSSASPSAPPTQAIPALDLSREYAAIRDEVLRAVTEVCDRQQFILGPAAARFEAAAAEACGAAAGIGCANGTDALWLALAAAGIQPGDAVITTPFSFFSTASSILRVGATPIFADIDPQTLNLCPTSVRYALHEAQTRGQRVTALLPVHLFGQPADMEALGKIAAENSLRLIEDAAQAFGACWSGRPAGSLGDAAAFSFYPTKNLSAFGDAGLLTTTDETLAERARALRNHGMRRRYFHDEIGWNSRLDGIQAAVLEVKLKRLPAGNARRRQLAALYTTRLEEAGLVAATAQDGLTPPFVDPRAESIFHQYVVRAPRRDALRTFLAEHGIGTEIYYPLPLHGQEALRFLGYQQGDFPVSEQAANQVLALPMYPELREDEVEAVVAAIASFYS